MSRPDSNGWTARARGCCFTVSTAKSTVHLPLVGSRAATCALAAAALAWGLGIDRSAVVAGLESLEPVAGHLEAVFEGQDFEVRIDAAQTPTLSARPGHAQIDRLRPHSLCLEQRRLRRPWRAPPAGRRLPKSALTVSS